MAQTKAGAQKVSASRAGVSLKQFESLTKRGLKWCVMCRKFQPTKDFHKDASRYDGFTSSCRSSRNTRSKVTYIPKARPHKGRSFVPARDGDKKQARRRVNYFVEAGIIPHPNTIPCVDCGHVFTGNGKRHEYDHHLGYAAKNHEAVESTCSTCHHVREKERINNGI